MTTMQQQELFPGVWRMTFGQAERFTPVQLRCRQAESAALNEMGGSDSLLPVLQDLTAKHTPRGVQIEIGLDPEEQLYGLGLQLLSFNQRGKKKTLRVNSDPIADLGDSHAPVPFFVSTKGYGVLIDTARYATFYMGSTVPVEASESTKDTGEVKLTTEELYRSRNSQNRSKIIVEVPLAKGVDVYVFAGPTMLQALQRYNLFSGGGCLPPRWGLGVWYRCCGNFDQPQVLALAKEFRDAQIPCDVIGLEPGWQSHAYSCSHVWNEKFPTPEEMISSLDQMDFRVNLWTHIFTDSTSPIYNALLPYSGNYKVFNGIVPDLTIPESRKIFADHHAKAHVDLGVSGYKLDECDGSDFIASPWSFPELSEFPSGLDGEQMHSLIGMTYQDTIEEIFLKRNQRTYCCIRNSHALAANYPFVLYSDLYKHQDFIRGLVNSGFSGLLWTPEVRDAASEEDLIRRMQTTILSPMALINAWYIKNPPWKQWRMAENNRDEFLGDWKDLEDRCRKILMLRMQLIPYLYTAFVNYYRRGVPPFRALVLDYPDDKNIWAIDDQYLMGDRMMVAPVTAGQSKRAVYFPQGAWRDFWSGERIEGGCSLERDVPLDQIPIFIKDDSLLPLAQPTLNVNDPAAFDLTVQVYGSGSSDFTLYEDDGVSFDFKKSDWPERTLSWNAQSNLGSERLSGDKNRRAYRIVRWDQR